MYKLGNLVKLEVFIDDVPVMLLSGMTVRHALMGAGLWSKRAGVRIVDEWGNELGFDGALHHGMRMRTLSQKKKEEIKNE